MLAAGAERRVAGLEWTRGVSTQAHSRVSWNFLFAKAQPAGHPCCPPLRLSLAGGWLAEPSSEARENRGCWTLKQRSPFRDLSPLKILGHSEDQCPSQPQAGQSPLKGHLPLGSEHPGNTGNP